jgi:hypothetical protein
VILATALRCALGQTQNNQRFCFHTHWLSYSAPLYSNKADKWRGFDTRFADGVRALEGRFGLEAFDWSESRQQTPQFGKALLHEDIEGSRLYGEFEAVVEEHLT